LVLVQVKKKCGRSLPVRPPCVEQTSRLGSREPVASGVKCRPHGGKNSKTKSWTVKASRPLIHVLVVNDNHCGLTFLLRYKNRLVR
jgi:hypothetical protein